MFFEFIDVFKIIVCLLVNLIVFLSEYSLIEIVYYVMYLFFEKYYIFMCCIILVMINLVYYIDLLIFYYNKIVYNDYNFYIVV